MTIMGDFQVLKEQLEIGLPLESAALLAGYMFEEIEQLEQDSAITREVRLAEARLMSKHLLNVNAQSEDNPRMSTWMLERKFPQHFAGTTKLSPSDIPHKVILEGVNPK